MDAKRLQIDQLDQQLQRFTPILQVPPPSKGWVRTIRKCLGMSLSQLANRLSMTRQSVQNIEIRERDGRISINGMKQVADALDLTFVYGFIPKDGSLSSLIERRSREMAEEIINRASHTMGLENQANDSEYRLKSIDALASELRREIPKKLWD